jgi:hypothetical protein
VAQRSSAGQSTRACIATIWEPFGPPGSEYHSYNEADITVWKPHLVRGAWDETVRVVASIQARTASPSLILHRASESIRPLPIRPLTHAPYDRRHPLNGGFRADVPDARSPLVLSRKRGVDDRLKVISRIQAWTRLGRNSRGARAGAGPGRAF